MFNLRMIKSYVLVKHKKQSNRDYSPKYIILYRKINEQSL